MLPDTPAHLWDALDAAKRAGEAVAGLELTDYLADWIRQSAVERKLEIVGEALNRIRRGDPGVADRIPELKAIIATRNVIVHRYDDVDHVRVWAMLASDLPDLVHALTALLEEAGDPTPLP